MNGEWVRIDDDKSRGAYAKMVEERPELKGTENDMPVFGEHIARPVKTDG